MALFHAGICLATCNAILTKVDIGYVNSILGRNYKYGPLPNIFTSFIRYKVDERGVANRAVGGGGEGGC